MPKYKDLWSCLSAYNLNTPSGQYPYREEAQRELRRLWDIAERAEAELAAVDTALTGPHLEGTEEQVEDARQRRHLLRRILGRDGSD